MDLQQFVSSWPPDVRRQVAQILRDMEVGAADAGDILLAGWGPAPTQKIAAIRAIRQYTGLSLVHAKGLIDSIPAHDRYPTYTTEDFVAELRGAGVIVERKGVEPK